MKFKELNEAEIKILSEDERELYFKRLRLYQQRLAFVEKIEQIEKAGIKYEKPKMERIKPIIKVKLEAFKPIDGATIKLPTNIAKREMLAGKTNLCYNESFSLRKRICAMTPSSVRIGNRPMIVSPSIQQLPPISISQVSVRPPKVNIPSASFTGKRFYKVSGVSSGRVAACPKHEFKPIAKIGLIGIPRCQTTSVRNINFMYEGRKIKKLPKIQPQQLPSPIRYKPMGVTGISAMPHIPQPHLPEKKYARRKYKINDIPQIQKIKTPDISLGALHLNAPDIPKVRISMPSVVYRPAKERIVSVPKISIPRIDLHPYLFAFGGDESTGTQSDRTKRKILLQNRKTEVNVGNKESSKTKQRNKVPNIPDVGTYSPPECNRTISIELKKLKPVTASICEISQPRVSSGDIPAVKIKPPVCSDSEIKDILDIVHSELR